MSVMKPILQTFGGGGVQAPSRARESHQSRLAQNAALGLDNFASLLQDSATKGENLPRSQAGVGLPISSERLGYARHSTGTSSAASSVGSSLASSATPEPAASAGTVTERPLTSQEQYMRNMQQIQALERLKNQAGDAGNESIAQLQQILMQKNTALRPQQSLSFDAAHYFRESSPVLQLKSQAHKGINAESDTSPSAFSAGAAASSAMGDPQAFKHVAAIAEKLVTTVESFVKEASETGKAVAERSLGFLASIFESGKDGIAAIGYDQTGGTSYGMYQIASKTGTMTQFIRFLDEQAPDLAQQLKAAGPANTGSRKGNMPDVWRDIAQKEPERFEALQSQFIFEQHFTPAMGNLSDQIGVKRDDLSPVMQEVLFSTAVQHGAGGAGRIVARAMRNVGIDKLTSEDPVVAREAEERLVRQIYAIRSKQFGSSTPTVQAAVKNRLNSEMNTVVSMLKDNYSV